LACVRVPSRSEPFVKKNCPPVLPIVVANKVKNQAFG
jgi:hypothetical protein